jgi:hypothetical protein
VRRACSYATSPRDLQATRIQNRGVEWPVRRLAALTRAASAGSWVGARRRRTPEQPREAEHRVPKRPAGKLTCGSTFQYSALPPFALWHDPEWRIPAVTLTTLGPHGGRRGRCRHRLLRFARLAACVLAFAPCTSSQRWCSHLGCRQQFQRRDARDGAVGVPEVEFRRPDTNLGLEQRPIS